ncbi:MAG TPA: hypothetical protein EYN06_10050 [Myxococcales bacterium]|nr:hypothetical protein [Myxococcales bacterium]HIN86812.1 hypothetical protein [Myxococcales bacterium]
MPLPEEKVFTEPKTGTIRQIANRLQHPDGELSGDDKATLARLVQRDARVRAHENAHQSAGGGVVMGGASYTYQRGPNGKLYAIGGSIMIDSSPVYGNPQATIQKMQQVRSAALAPADPSAADMRVASAATNSEMAARSVLTQMLVETRQQIREGLSPARRSIANEYARETQLANTPEGATNIANKPAQEMLPQPTQTPKNLELKHARSVAATYQQARLEAPPDVTDSLIG